jgi:hypothetical protein
MVDPVTIGILDSARGFFSRLLQLQGERAKERAAQYKELFIAIEKHRHWLSVRCAQILGETVDPGPSPMADIEVITSVHFPAKFTRHVRALEDASNARENWVRQSAGKGLFADFEAMNGDMKKALEILAQSEEDRDEAYGPNEKALRDFLAELRKFAESEFGGGGLRDGLRAAIGAMG